MANKNNINVPAGRVRKVVAARLSWTMPCGFLNGVCEPMDLDINIDKENEIFSSFSRLKAYISVN